MKIVRSKKLLILIVLFGLINITVSCQQPSKNDDTNKSDDNKNDDDTNRDDALDKYSDEDIIFKVITKLNDKRNYLVTAKGVTFAKLGFINYEQNTKTSLYAMDDVFYNDISSESTIVSHYHKLLSDGDSIKYYDSDNKKYIECTKDEYKNLYGRIPNYQNVFNYDITKDDIISTSRSKTDKTYIISYVLEPMKVSRDLRKQMVMFGALDKEPVFTYIELKIFIDEEFNITAFENIEKYKIVKTVLGIKNTMECTQKLNSTIIYDNYELPNLNDFNM